MRSFLTLEQFDGFELSRIVDRSCALINPHVKRHDLSGKRIGLYFPRPSTRTRTAFTMAAHALGAATIQYGPKDLQLTTGETLSDTALVLSQYLDCLVVRTYETSELLEVARFLPVINALTEDEHPSQAIADLAAIQHEFGRLSGLHILFVGEGNNIARSLCLATARIEGIRLFLMTPPGYGLTTRFLKGVRQTAYQNGSSIQQSHDLKNLPRAVDIIYTSRWRSMGQEKECEGWREVFRPYQVTDSLIAKVAKNETSIFLHDLPAERGAEVSDVVLDGPRSRVLIQAKCKEFSAISIFEWLLTK